MSNLVESIAKEKVSELLEKKSVNIGDIREELSEFNQSVMDEVKAILERNSPTLEYGESNSDGRLWLVD